MTENGRLERYADLAVRSWVNMAEGQELMVYATSLAHAPLVRALARAGYRNGARYVEAYYEDQHIRRAMIELAPEETLTWSPPWMFKRAEDRAANKSAFAKGDRLTGGKTEIARSSGGDDAGQDPLLLGVQGADLPTLCLIGGRRPNRAHTLGVRVMNREDASTSVGDPRSCSGARNVSEERLAPCAGGRHARHPVRLWSGLRVQGLGRGGSVEQVADVGDWRG